MPDNEPIAPQNFDFVERYVSNLLVDRVKKMRRFALEHLENHTIGVDEETLCGYILQLTELNKNQK